MSKDPSLRDRIAAWLEQPGLQLPVFNSVALELQSELKDESAPAGRIEALVSKDPALVAQVLRMANSANFAGLSETGTIRAALMRLGVKQVARLAIAAAQLSLYKTRDPALKTVMEALWQQAYASAMGAGWVAERCGRAGLADEAFLAGLLHDVGKLMIVRALEQIGEQSPKAPAPPADLVRELVESLHCEQGYRLMKRWNLPEVYCTVGRDHHAGDVDASQPVLVIVRLMDQVCAKMGIGCEARPDLMPAASPEARILGLNELRAAELEILLEDCFSGPEKLAA